MARPAVAAPARAAQPNAEARARYESGSSHYALGEYAEALADFKEAYRLRNDAAILYNIAQCHRQLGDPDQAARLYRSYLRERPDAKNRADVEKIIAEMDTAAEKKRQAAVVVAPPPQPAPAPTPEPVAVTSTDAALTAPPPERPKPLVKKPWFWVAVVGGAGVVAAAVTCGIVFGVKKDPHASLSPVELQ